MAGADIIIWERELVDTKWECKNRTVTRVIILPDGVVSFSVSFSERCTGERARDSCKSRLSSSRPATPWPIGSACLLPVSIPFLLFNSYTRVVFSSQRHLSRPDIIVRSHWLFLGVHDAVWRESVFTRDFFSADFNSILCRSSKYCWIAEKIFTIFWICTQRGHSSKAMSV